MYIYIFMYIFEKENEKEKERERESVNVCVRAFQCQITQIPKKKSPQYAPVLSFETSNDLFEFTKF